MSAAGNPPQLQLSLGHQTFKRSFTQFGLDVDDGEDSRSEGSSANASSSSLSGTSSNGSTSSAGGVLGSGTSRSVSGGSSYSSQAAADVFGYNDGERAERNKRARSEGPEREALSVTVGAASSSSAESMDTTSVLSLPASSGSLLDSGSSQGSLGGQTSLHQTSSNISSLNPSSGFTLPILDFGPQTPSVAEFVALRTSTSNARTTENPPGFANMLSPRSSSPAPPPAVEIDVAMQDDDDADDESFSSIGPSRVGLQNFGSSTSSGFLDTARSDVLLSSATERLRSAMERARTFDRMLAPLRSDTTDGIGESSQQPYGRPRLPPFDFESHRVSPPSYSEATNNLAGLSSSFDRLAQYPAGSTGLGNSPSFVPGTRHLLPLHELHPLSVGGEVDSEEEEEDDIIVDRELTVEPDLEESNDRAFTGNNSLSGSESTPSLYTRENEDSNALSVSSRALDDRVRAINGLTDRTLDDLRSFISTSETEDDGRLPSPHLPALSFFSSPQLDPHLSANENTSHAPQIQLDLTSPQTSLGSSRPTEGILPLGFPRTISQNGEQGGGARQEANTGRFRGWPWNDLLGPSFTDSSVPGLGPRYTSETQTQPRATRQQSPHLQLRSDSPFLPFPSLSGPLINSESLASMNETRRAGRMVPMYIEPNVSSRFAPSVRRPAPNEQDLAQNRMRSLGSTQAPRQLSTTRANLPTLRSAILEPLRRDDDASGSFADGPGRDEVSREDRTGRETARASTSGVATSMTGTTLRSRVAHGDHLATRPSLLELGNRPWERLARGQRNLSPLVFERRPDEEDSVLPSSANTRAFPFPGTSRITGTSGSSIQTAGSYDSHSLPTSTPESVLSGPAERSLLLQEWFPPIHEEDRLRDTARATRLREMRERHRLSIPTRPSLSSQAPPLQSLMREDLDMSRIGFFDEEMRLSMAAGGAEALHQIPRERIYLSDDSDASETSGVVPSSSTEAAAFFASGPEYGSPGNTPGRPSAMRRRHLRSLADSDDDNTIPNLRNNAWDGVEMILDPPNILGVGRDTRRSPSQAEQSFTSPTDNLLQMLYSRRGLQDNGVTSQQQPSSVTNDLASMRGTSSNSEFHYVPPPSESRTRPWSSINIRSPLRRGQDPSPTDVPRRSVSSRNTASRPPSLPPLPFDRLSGTSADGSDNAGSRIFGVGEVAGYRIVPGRGPAMRVDRDGGAVDSTTRSTPQRSSDFTSLDALRLRAEQARQAVRESERRSGAALPAAPHWGRSQGYQQAMNVLGADGLPRSLRQRFDGAFHRESEQGRPNTSRNEAHVRWGEIVDDDAESHPSGVQNSIRPWIERARRRSTSALFAPPPDNADNTPPNRNRGAGPAGGDPHVHPQGSQLDWFSMISSSRARLRHRSRLARLDEDASSRSPFFRIGRSRPGLRNMGDFVRDEDFDTSYEGLIALAQTLGEVKPRSTPAHVINALPTGLYKDWRSTESDTRCPICLDDYKISDVLLMAEPCDHWCHKECFEQWLHTAQTCPVCRTKIKPAEGTVTPPPVAGPSRVDRIHHPENLDTSGDSEDDYSFLSSSPNRAFFESMLSSDRPPRAPQA